MDEQPEYLIPPELRAAAADVDYELESALDAVVSLRAEIPEDAFTASILGTERAGHGVLINDTGLIVTIGYLVTEASSIWIVTRKGQAVAGHLVGYDYETGFGLVQALGRLDVAPMPVGDSDALSPGDELVVAGCGGIGDSLKVTLAARHEFAGYWEYVLDEALFTSPPHPNWGGAALIDETGQLAGIGSLFIDQISSDLGALEGNMMVPINLLKPIMEELMMYGRTLKPARPWLGMFVSEVENRFMVAGVYDNAPAAGAGLQAGDIVVELDGQTPHGLASLFRTMWAVGPAGTEIPLTIERDGETLHVSVPSVDRRDFWKAPEFH